MDTPLYGLATFYTEQGHYAQAELFFQRALRIQEQALGLEHPDVAHALHGLATLYTKQSQYEQVEPLYEQALRIREQRLGVGHGDTIKTLAALKRLHQMQRREEPAEENAFGPTNTGNIPLTEEPSS